jgi:hypothetical protein
MNFLLSNSKNGEYIIENKEKQVENKVLGRENIMPNEYKTY